MTRRDSSIYVEIDIAASLERVWQLTQSPAEHERWDLRFTQICYLPRPDDSQPQRFKYATRIGFGLAIGGLGETVGEQSTSDGIHSSALRFWSDDPKSLISEGSGYWKYVPTPTGTRFLTRYDYAVRFGVAGRVFDRLVFRPLMGWATAWSFDRLRLWIERGLDPAVALRLSLVYALARAGVGFVWIYHGLVPKLIFAHADELAMFADAGLSPSASRAACIGAGVAEMVFGIAVLVFWRTRWPLWITVIAMPLAMLAVAARSPRFLTSAFNVITLNLTTALLAVIALALVGLFPRPLAANGRTRRSDEHLDLSTRFRLGIRSPSPTDPTPLRLHQRRRHRCHWQRRDE